MLARGSLSCSPRSLPPPHLPALRPPSGTDQRGRLTQVRPLCFPVPCSLPICTRLYPLFYRPSSVCECLCLLLICLSLQYTASVRPPISPTPSLISLRFHPLPDLAPAAKKPSTPKAKAKGRPKSGRRGASKARYEKYEEDAEYAPDQDQEEEEERPPASSSSSSSSARPARGRSRSRPRASASSPSKGKGRGAASSSSRADYEEPEPFPSSADSSLPYTPIRSKAQAPVDVSSPDWISPKRDLNIDPALLAEYSYKGPEGLEPEECTVQQLKSWLTALDVPLPQENKKKQFYVEMVYQHEPKLKGKTPPAPAAAGKKKKKK